MILEAAIENFAEAKRAVEAGAHRLEVCSALTKFDGLTPDIEMYKSLNIFHVPKVVMIRPYPGDFYVDSTTLELMLDQMQEFKNLGARNFVFGALTRSNEVDIPTTKQIVEAAGPECTTIFHKAIDRTNNILVACEALIECGVDKVLTSGGKPNVLMGISTIVEMHKILQHKITIVAGGGLTKGNLEQISEALPFCEYHGRKIV